MSLDLFASQLAAADQDVAQNAARFLPAGFGETFDVAWRAGTEFNNSIGYQIARSRALADYADDITRKTGERLPSLAEPSGELQMVGATRPPLEMFNEAQAKLQEKYPGLDYLQPLTEERVNQMALDRMRKAHDDARAMQSRETTWGGTLGGLTGALAAGFEDPVLVATLPLGGVGEAGIALRALEFAGIGGGTAAASAAISASNREAAAPGSSREIPGEILGATIAGGLLGGGFAALGKLLRAGGKTLPTAAREDLNAATSEAQLNAVNPFPTAGGEAAARDALADAMTSTVRGEPVRAADNFDPVHVADYAETAGAKTPDEIAAAAERHLRPETFDQVPDVERFDPLPAAGEDAATYWDRRLAAASPEERAALGATDAPRLAEGETIEQAAIKVGDRIYRGATHSEALDRASAEMKISPEDFLKQLEGHDNVGIDGFVTSDGRYLTRKEAYAIQDEIDARQRAPVGDAAPRDLPSAEVARLADDAEIPKALDHDVEHILAANPEAEINFQTRLDDGSYKLDPMKLKDVLAEINADERAGKDLLACLVHVEAAE